MEDLLDAVGLRSCKHDDSITPAKESSAKYSVRDGNADALMNRERIDGVATEVFDTPVGWDLLY